VQRFRAGLLLVVAMAGLLPLWRIGLACIRTGGGDLEGILQSTVVAALLGSATWVLLLTAAVALDVLCDAAHPTLRAPRIVVLVVAACCGLSLAAIPAASATDLDGLPLPDRPTGHPARVTSTVVVAPGDTLSGLAREAGTTWPRLYAANRAAVGDDPDLIHPGLRLRLPHPSHEEGKDHR
jgi:nucleoid-associated protein YgaU